MEEKIVATENVLKHFWHSTDYDGGRIAVTVENGWLGITQISGKAPSALIFLAVVCELGEEFLAECNQLHRERPIPHTWEIRTGMSGCGDVLVREREDEALKDYPISSGFHVSMYGKLNEGVRVLMADVPPLVKGLMSWYELDEFDPFSVSLKEAPIHEYEWRHQGEEQLAISDSGRLSV